MSKRKKNKKKQLAISVMSLMKESEEESINNSKQSWAIVQARDTFRQVLSWTLDSIECLNSNK